MTSESAPVQTALARRSWLMAVVVAALGLLASFGAWRHRARQESEAIHAEFRQEAELLHRAVQREVSLYIEVLDSLRALHTLSARISDEDFAEFVVKGLRHQQEVLEVFGFAQRIPDEVRAEFEAAGDPGRAALLLLEPDGEGTKAAARRPEYFPLTYQSPADGLGRPNGFDLASQPESQLAIARMESLPGAAVGAPSADGRLLFSPIYYPSVEGVDFPPPGYLAGFAVALWRPDRILERAQAATTAGRVKAEFREGPPGNSILVRHEPLLYEAPVRVADHNWLLTCTPGPSFAAARRVPLSSYLLVIGLVLTALVAGQLASVARRTRRVEELVRRRTADLREAHRERLRLEEEIHGTAAREQQRVGRDLHDSLGQKLTGAMMLSRTLARAPDGEEARAGARQLNEVLKDAVAQVRRMARGLAPVALGEDGLADALRQLAEDTRQTYALDCALRLEGDLRGLEPKDAEHLYYLAREAVHNAARHARAARITVALERDKYGWSLVVDDDGIGLPPDAEQRGGMGLKILRHRAEALGARLDIAPRPEGGTRVQCRKG